MVHLPLSLVFLVLVPLSPFCGGYVPLFFSVAILYLVVCSGSTGGCFSEVEGREAEKGEAATTISANERDRERERAKKAATKRARTGAATTTQEKEREGKSHHNAREVERRRSHHHQKEGTGGYPSLLCWLPSPATTWWIPSLSLIVLWRVSSLLLSHFMADPSVLFCGGSVHSFSLWWFSASLSFLRGSPSPLSVCGCPSRALFLPWLRSLLFWRWFSPSSRFFL